MHLPIERTHQQYSITAPKSTHWRPATCAEVECEQYINGWRTVIDESTDLGQRQAAYIRHTSGRHYVEERTSALLTLFTFPAGQNCFGADHKVRLERPEIFTVKKDLTVPGRGYVHSGPDSWLDDFATHQEKLKKERGE